jgi:hypothetical protein
MLSAQDDKHTKNPFNSVWVSKLIPNKYCMGSYNAAIKEKSVANTWLWGFTKVNKPTCSRFCATFHNGGLRLGMEIFGKNTMLSAYYVLSSVYFQGKELSTGGRRGLNFWIENVDYYYHLRRYSDWLRAGRSGDHIPVGARFFAHVQTGAGAHPVSYIMGTGSSTGCKTVGAWCLRPTPSYRRDREWVELYLHSPSGSYVACYKETFTFYFNSILIINVPV